MHLRNLFAPFFLLLVLTGLAAAAPDANDTQARVYFETKQELYNLRTAGLDIIKTTPGYIEIVTNPGELGDLSDRGYHTEIIHESLIKFYQSRLPRTADSQEMGGYKTLSEIQATMMDIAANHPDIVAPPVVIGVTHEERNLWAVKISDNPTVDEDEPEVLFTAAIHAREVITPEFLLYYMDWLTANYGTDPEATDLVNTREIWFVPVVNPDGYYHNQVIAPEGGGMWRKNRRNNFDGTYGVDLNRNFGYEWGYDNAGSSPYTSSETYRGPAGFSEPETQAMRDFQLNHDFVLSCYYHSHSNIFLYPWGYERFPTTDDDIFVALGDTIFAMNGYIPGKPWELLYPTNGGSFDWEYHEQTLKNKTFGTSIEIGGDFDGFWPPLYRIPILIADNMEPIKFLTRVAGHIYEIRPPEGPQVTLPPQTDGAAYTVSWTDVDPYNPGVAYDLKELVKPHAETDDCDTLRAWITNEWTVSTARSHTPPSSYFSGSHDYANSYLQTAYPYEVQDGDTLSFWTWYQLEVYTDFAYVQVSTDGLNFVSIPGSITSNYNPTGTNSGNGISGSTGEWLQAYFDLSAFVGQQVWFRIAYIADATDNREGMYIDDLHPHLVFESETTLGTGLTASSFEVTNRPLGVYYYQVRAKDAQDQWGSYSLLASTDVLAADAGDLDLDGLKNTVADLVLFDMYFDQGLAAFNIYPSQQIIESDFNCDATNLSSADRQALEDLIMGIYSPCYAAAPAPSGRSEAVAAAQAAVLPSYAVTFQSTTFDQDDTVWVDLVVTAGDSSLLGYQFYVEYDPAGMNLLGIRNGNNLTGWGDPVYRAEAAGSLARLRISATANSGAYPPAPEALDPSLGPMVLVRLVFEVNSDIAINRDFNFVWDDCGDNTIVVGGYVDDQLQLSRLAYSGTVYNADLEDITGTDPVYGGSDYTCGYGLFGGTPAAAVAFTDGRMHYEPPCCQGHTGDANHEGGDEPTIGDISLIIEVLYIKGSGEFYCITEADANRSGGPHPTMEDITIGDINILIDHLYINQEELPLCY